MLQIAEHDALTVSEAAAVLRVSVRTVQRWIANGDLAPIRKLPGRTGAYLFDRAAIEELAAARGAEGKS